MSRHEEMRNRLNRVLGPRLLPDDITHLFLWLRERAFGSAAIREIGDFVAHSDERKKGPVTDELRDYLFHSRLMHRLGPDINLEKLPADFVPTISRNFDRLPIDLVKRVTGQSRKDARRTLDTLLSKFGPDPNGGTTVKHRIFTRPEVDVLVCVLQYAQARAAFTAEDVTRGFLMAAQKNQLIDRIDNSSRQRFKPLLAMYSLQAMHRTTIVLQDAWKATLKAGTYEGKLAAFAEAGVTTHKPGELVGIRVPIFTTDLNADEWCGDRLEVGEYVLWEVPIELTPERKLVALAE